MTESSPPRSGIVAQEVCKSFGTHVVLDKVSLTVEQGTILALLGPNGAGKTTMVRILSTLIPADAGSMTHRRSRRGHRSRRGPGRHRRHRSVLGRGQPAHRSREPAADGRPSPPRPRGWPTAGRRAVGAVRPHRRRRQAAVDLLGWDATAARPGDDAGRRAPGDLPRRAHDRLGPAQPAHHVGDHPRARRGRRHHPAHHPVPGRGRPAGQPDRGARPGADRRRRNPGRVEEPHPRRPRPTPLRRPRPAAICGPAPRGGCSRRGPARPPGPRRRQRGLAP